MIAELVVAVSEALVATGASLMLMTIMLMVAYVIVAAMKGGR